MRTQHTPHCNQEKAATDAAAQHKSDHKKRTSRETSSCWMRMDMGPLTSSERYPAVVRIRAYKFGLTGPQGRRDAALNWRSKRINCQQVGRANAC